MKRKQSTASASNKKRKKGDDNSPTKANWWSDRIEAIREHVVVPSTHTVDDTPLSWASRNEFHDDRFYEFVQVDTARNVVKKKDRKHTTGMSKKKLAPDEVIRSRKIRVRPTRRQKRIFHDHWANTARYLYNETLDLAQEQGYTGSKQVLRNVLLDPELNPKADECEFVFYTHKKWKKENGKPPANARILNRDGKTRAIFSFFDAREASKEGLKAKRTKGEKCPKNPTMKRKTRDDMNKSIQIDVNGGKPSVTWTSEGFLFWKDSGFGVLRVCEGTGKRRHKGGLIKQVKRTGNRKGREIRRLTALNGGSRETHTRVTFKYERPGRYYMIIPVVVKKQPVCEEAREIIAFDPGIRTFQTGYDNRGRVVEYGASKEETTKGGVAQLYKLGRRIDKLWSLNDTTKKDRYENKKEREQYKNRRRKLRRRIGELSYRITNLKRDLHWKMAREITSCYDDVLMPVFRVKEMIGKEGRRINKETVKKMLHWSHYEFREHLKHKAEERGTVVHMVTEHYSSKTCGACGHVHWKLGSNKTFQCPSCQFTIDRDHNGARNIFLMNIERFVGRIRIPSGLGAGPIVTTSSDG